MGIADKGGDQWGMSALMSALLEGSRESDWEEEYGRCQGMEMYKEERWSSNLGVRQFGGVGGFGDFESLGENR